MNIFMNGITLSETNIFAPENGWLEDDPFLLGRQAYFEGQTVRNFRECNDLGTTNVISKQGT